MKEQKCVVCPVCGHNKVIRESLPNPFDIEAEEFIQIREGGGKIATGKKGRGQGRGVGWAKIGSVPLDQAISTGYRPLAVNLAKQIDKVSKELKRLGLLP